MSSKGYAEPLRIDGVTLRPLQRLYLLFCLLAGVSLFGLPLPLYLVLFLLSLFLLLAYRTWTLRCELGGQPVQLIWDSAQRWWWLQDGKERQVLLSGDSYLSSRISVLHFRDCHGGRRRALVLLPSASGEQRYRQLLVRFRITADPLVTP